MKSKIGISILLKKTKEIPLELLNTVSIVSALITITMGIVALFSFVNGTFTGTMKFTIIIIALVAFIILLFIKMRKYSMLYHNLLATGSECYKNLSAMTRNCFFDIMHEHKKNTLNGKILYEKCFGYCQKALDSLCDMMKTVTCEDISACIKLIAPGQLNDDDKEPYNDSTTIDIDSAELLTFCRSSNSDSNRKIGTMNKLEDDSELNNIIKNNADYFYEQDLMEYERALPNKVYKDSHDWTKYYMGTIVVPIKISYKLLYHVNIDNGKHVLGFLCIDSLSRNAFTDKQKVHNLSIMNSYAAALYIILSQYRHYVNIIWEGKKK